jgi:UDP-N-acetylglucosamine--N-acetylmuramyl-(pentapeptide) pyrophosphoryl-undecaprenol N-acetylglucosamine transferase
MKENKLKTIAITTGGTGGHVFPAQALANELTIKNYKVVAFIDKRAEKYSNLWVADKVYTIASFGLQNKKILTILKMFFLLSIGTLQSIFIFFKNKPYALYSFGGYSSVPVVISAILFRVPIIMHEQNAVLGKAHKLFLRYAKFLGVSFLNTKNISTNYKNKVILTGLPLRSIFLKQLSSFKKEQNNKITLTFLGGSLGAKIFGENIVKAFLKLSIKQQEQFVVYHQCIDAQRQSVEKLWQSSKVNFVIKPFFENIVEILNLSDVVICRSGASSIFEINALAKYAIYVPFKLSAENHQLYNADAMKNNAGADVVLEDNFNEETIFEILTNLLLNNINIKEKEEKAKSQSILNASENLINLLKQL